jgi:hypothetical protein
MRELAKRVRMAIAPRLYKSLMPWSYDHAIAKKVVQTVRLKFGKIGPDMLVLSEDLHGRGTSTLILGIAQVKKQGQRMSLVMCIYATMQGQEHIPTSNSSWFPTEPSNYDKRCKELQSHVENTISGRLRI